MAGSVTVLPVEQSGIESGAKQSLEDKRAKLYRLTACDMGFSAVVRAFNADPRFPNWRPLYAKSAKGEAGREP